MVFLCVFIIAHFAKSNRIWRGLGIVTVIFCLLFVFGSANPELFSWILVDFLGEDLTLNGRTVLLGFWHYNALTVVLIDFTLNTLLIIARRR